MLLRALAWQVKRGAPAVGACLATLLAPRHPHRHDVIRTGTACRVQRVSHRKVEWLAKCYVLCALPPARVTRHHGALIGVRVRLRPGCRMLPAVAPLAKELRTRGCGNVVRLCCLQRAAQYGGHGTLGAGVPAAAWQCMRPIQRKVAEASGTRACICVRTRCTRLFARSAPECVGMCGRMHCCTCVGWASRGNAARR